MKNIKYIVLLSAFGLAACGGETSKTIEVEQTPVVETTPEVESPAEVEAPSEEVKDSPDESLISGINPNFAVPDGIKISATSNSVTLDWNVVANATSYQVYYNEGEDVSIDNGMVYYTTLSEFTHENLSGNLHSYRVQAVIGDAASDLSILATADLSVVENITSDSSNDS